ncbi:aspartyl protease family protein [Sphingomonas sp.]|uniref:aspartyl protease family protein n=1 Tax=Sphingomonas sp. TaxID=28214 RepID=UPI003B3A0D5F
MAEIPVMLSGQRAMVDAQFGTHQTRFILDSGAFYSTLSRASAAEFELSTEPAPPTFRLRGINGDTSAGIAKAKNFTLAGIALPPVEFIVGGSDTGTAGLLGQNILGLADVEYDLPHGMVRLMKVTGCGNVDLAYWAEGKPFSIIPLERNSDERFRPHTVGTVSVNGVKMRAIFDTGATSTIMTLAAAKRAGITPASPGVVSVGTSTGLGSKQVPSWLASFDKIDLGGEIVPHPKFRIANIDIDGDMLIGFDFFLTHRMFVSNANHQLYMTYEGGRLFGITPTGARSAAGEKIDLTDMAAVPTDAEGFSRRGTVLMSQRKFADALSDFDKSVAMAPQQGRYIYLRALAHLALGQSLLASADLDKAVTLAPDDAEMRLTRARLRLRHRDTDGAAEDIKAADRVLPAASDHRLQLAGLYNSIEQPDAAITNYDAWLKMHSEDADRASAYNGRCWSRALLNRELERALSDCNTALRLRPGYPAFLDSRALVQLRLGRLDAAIADYDAALTLTPRNAWSLYVRAIAEKRAGRTDAAEADRKAALAINPDVGKRAAKFGLEG